LRKKGLFLDGYQGGNGSRKGKEGNWESCMVIVIMFLFPLSLSGRLHIGGVSVDLGLIRSSIFGNWLVVFLFASLGT